MKTWQEMLGRTWKESAESYGPHGQAILSAFDVFAGTEWLRSVGRPMEEGSTVVRVASWEEALAPLDDASGRYEPTGHLAAAVALLRPVETREPERGWWENAVADAGDYANLFPYIPASFDEERRERLYDYLYNYGSFLLAEIIGGDELGSTYFRELLPWFHAGRLPCGWEGNWPDGRLRVY